MAWLVTGGAGFIGSHLVAELLRLDERVVVLDDCSTGSLANLESLRADPRLTIRTGSACDAELVARLAPPGGTIAHLAAVVGVRRVLERQVEGIRVNIGGVEAALAAGERAGAKVLIASSSEVYGRRRDAPFAEDDDCIIGPSRTHRWSYATSKLLDEFLALAWWRERGVPVVVPRFFNVVGPRQSPRYGMVLPRFCAAALAGEPLEVHGDGQQTRCFLHVADAVRAILALCAEPRAVGEVVNVGSDHEVSVADLARRVVERGGSRSPIATIPYRDAFPDGGFADMPRRVPDLGKLRGLTGCTPTFALDAIIDDALAWARGTAVSARLVAAGGG